MHETNIGAVLAAAATSFILGGVWYSPGLFGKIWSPENGPSTKQAYHPAKAWLISFGFFIAAAFLFAYWLGPNPPLSRAVGTGALAGFGLVAASFGINYQFANRSFKMWLIDGGYHTAQFTIFGLILGLWH